MDLCTIKGRGNSPAADGTSNSREYSEELPSAERPAHVDVDNLCANMATVMTALVHYVTDYTGKAQPQLTNLWKLLAEGQRWLQIEMQEVPSEKKSPAYYMCRVCCRLMTCC